MNIIFVIPDYCTLLEVEASDWPKKKAEGAKLFHPQDGEVIDLWRSEEEGFEALGIIEWISVKKKLPKKPYPVLVTIDYGDGHPIVGMARYWASSGWERLTGSSFGPITGWAELPEPYMEDKDD